MEKETAIAKGNITIMIEEINTIIRLIDNLTDNLTKFHAFVLQQGSVAGLDMHIVNIQTAILETRQLFQEQIELYQKLSSQIELNEATQIGIPSKGVAEAEETLKQLRLKGAQIKTNKNKINYYLTVFNNMIIIFQNQKPIPQLIKEMIENIRQQLKSASK